MKLLAVARHRPLLGRSRRSRPGRAARRRADALLRLAPSPASASARSRSGRPSAAPTSYLASLRGVPVLTLTHPLGPNLEQLATYNPSIVLSSKTWQRGTPAMRRWG